ncbi:glycosyltransferase family 4 protein [Methylomarinum vadi]|uniref:glycosyltransferase family 4 protein n=1 Tax=Methylomarinum vadi TaxID=438855 RepID=UPI001362F3D5|nr:glycosyltransferase family 4 protein [Methylomarinum vadi]
MSQQLYIVRRNSGFGGAERVAERLAQNFSDQFEVHRLWAGNRFNGRVIPGRSGPPWWRSWWYTQHINQLPIYHQNSVVYSLEYGPNCDIYRAGDGVHRLNVLRRYGSNITWMVNPWHWLAPKLERNSFESARYIIANSNLVRSHIVQTYPHVQDKIVTIYNGFDETVFKLSSIDKAELRRWLGLPITADKILLLSGSGFERKGLHHAVDIVTKLHRQGCRAYLVVVGKGDSRYVNKAIEAGGLKDYILFKGLVDDVAQYYQAADLMVLLTRYDPFSNSCLEALACGCPVITTRNNGAIEVMKPYSGLVVNDVAEEDAIELCADYILQQTFQAEQIASSVSHLTSDQEKNAHLEVINRVFEEKKYE